MLKLSTQLECINMFLMMKSLLLREASFVTWYLSHQIFNYQHRCDRFLVIDGIIISLGLRFIECVLSRTWRQLHCNYLYTLRFVIELLLNLMEIWKNSDFFVVLSKKLKKLIFDAFRICSEDISGISRALVPNTLLEGVRIF